MAPSKNKIGVAIKYGSKAFFSSLYRPGATNFHICVKIMGLPKKIAAKNATFKYVTKVSWRAVKISLLSRASFFTASAYG